VRAPRRRALGAPRLAAARPPQGRPAAAVRRRRDRELTATQAVEGTPPAAEPRWGLGDAVGGWLVAESVAVVASGVLLSALGYIQPIGQAALDIVGQVTGGHYEAKVTPLWLVAVLELFLWLGLLGAPIYAARAKGNGVVRDFGLRVRPLDVPIGIAIGVACQLVLVPLVSLPWVLLLGKDLNELDDVARNLADKATDPFGVALLVLIVVLGAPVVEELFFRGLLQRSLLRKMGPVPAVAISSFVFALTHFQLLQFLALWAFGAVLGTLAYRTGRLGPGILAHMAFNAVTVIALVMSN
jgi:membrane protease YdiL (CAAX protease family)